ncbi:MAG: sensor histidine kinase, partial [Gemmatimonadota bacterium]
MDRNAPDPARSPVPSPAVPYREVGRRRLTVVSACLLLTILIASPPLALGSAAALAAQEARPLIEPPAHAIDQWTTEDGLPQNSVNAIVQAPDGNLWIGTFGGLVHFDGTRFTRVERTDSAGRHIDRVMSLAVAPDGTLWIGTQDGGLLRREAGAGGGHRGAGGPQRGESGRYDAFTTADGLPDDEVTALYASRDGALWIGTGGGGVARFVDGRFRRYREVGGRSVGSVVSFVEDRRGTLWINSTDGLFTLEDGELSTASPRAEALAEAEYMVLEDDEGARWFTLPDRMARQDEARVEVFDVLDGALVVEDPVDGYWVGTADDGLYFFRPDAAVADGFHRYPLPDGRLAYRVRSAHVDRVGNVWIGTSANGLLRAKRNLFTTFTTGHGLSHDVATAVYEDEGGTLWSATNCGGVNAIDRRARTVRVFNPRSPGDPEGDPCVFALGEAPEGTVWQGSWGRGVTRLTSTRDDLPRRVAGLADAVVLALYGDRGDTLWVGTNSRGLAAVVDGRVRATFTTADGLAHNSVRTIHRTRDGDLWIGTLGGLSRLRDGGITSYTAADGLSAEHVRSIHEDDAGRLWIGTYGGGLLRLHDGELTAIGLDDGLADDVVSSILEDDAGFLWMSGNRGIYRASLEALNAFADGEADRVHSVLYGVDDGLRNAETNGGFQPSAWKDSGGRLWFPTVEGVTVVDPADVVVDERPPTVAIAEVVVDGVSRAPNGAISVGPGRPNVEFRYAGLSLAAPEHVTYRYRLEGFEEEWIDAGSRQVAYYPRLAPGRYRFVVRAANRDGVWSDEGAALALRVVPPFWSTWWFRLAGLAAFGVVLVVVVRRRDRLARRRREAREAFSRRLIEAQEHERKRIAGALHDGLGQQLLVIRNRALLALRSDEMGEPAREQIREITDVASESLADVRGVAHALTPHELDHLGLSAALEAVIDAVAETSEIGLAATVDDVDGLLPTESEINLYRIVQEA